jgi:Fic family protein
MAIRERGDWEGWLKFFLRGVGETANEAAQTAQRILDLRERHRLMLQVAGTSQHAHRLLDLLFERPLLNVGFIEQTLSIAYVTANKLDDQFEQFGVLEETTGQRRNRRFRYAPYLLLFDERSSESFELPPVQTTSVSASFPSAERSPAS